MKEYPCHNSMKELCDELLKNKEVTSHKVIDVLMKIDRADFAPRNQYQIEPNPYLVM